MKVTPQILQELLDYNPLTGELTWKPRSRNWFTSDRGFNIWHARYSGCPALAAPASHGYLKGRVLYDYITAHRAAWAITYGKWPCGEIDHINGDPRDNRLVNLRDATPSENSQNRAIMSNNKSGVSGVSWHQASGRWRAYIGRGKDRRWLGRFKSLDDAVAARREAEIEMGYHPNHGRLRT
jgi:hypothetical protein